MDVELFGQYIGVRLSQCHTVGFRGRISESLATFEVQLRQWCSHNCLRWMFRAGRESRWNAKIDGRLIRPEGMRAAEVDSATLRKILWEYTEKVPSPCDLNKQTIWKELRFRAR